MNTTIILQRQVSELKENPQVAIALAACCKHNMGVIDQKELARLSKQANGSAYNPEDLVWQIEMVSIRSTRSISKILPIASANQSQLFL
ncbi:MAG: hypothetical protein ABWZ79_10700 [Pedobacter agri]